jgi:molybdopterin synthase catalytic subunit
VAIVSAAPHRGDAYEANRFVIEAIKERLPIWKRERFVDGSAWKRGGA